MQKVHTPQHSLLFLNFEPEIEFSILKIEKQYLKFFLMVLRFTVLNFKIDLRILKEFFKGINCENLILYFSFYTQKYTLNSTSGIGISIK